MAKITVTTPGDGSAVVGMIADADWLRRLVSTAVAADQRVIAPREHDGVVVYGEVETSREIASGHPLPGVPLKELFLDKTGTLVGPGGRARPKRGEHVRTLVVGCRPCEAAALAVMDVFFAWAGTNAYYTACRERATIVSFACSAPDGRCFCTSVGGGPASGVGADVLVGRLPGGALALAPQTPKGADLLRGVGGTRAAGAASAPSPNVPARFDLAAVRRWLSGHAREEHWQGVAGRCMGCGVCRFVCPTCHCFEMSGAVNWCCGGGCWSRQCCALSLFAARGGREAVAPERSRRWREWILHKFVYFPQTFGRLACVGCGQCLRTCGAGENLVRVLQDIEGAAVRSPQGEPTTGPGSTHT